MKHIKLFESFQNYPDHYYRTFSENIGAFKDRKIFFVSDMDIDFDDIDSSLIKRIDNPDDFINLVNSQTNPLVLWMYYTHSSMMSNELSMLNNKEFILIEGINGENIQKNLPKTVEQYFI
jgi:hypothetical protein